MGFFNRSCFGSGFSFIFHFATHINMCQNFTHGNQTVLGKKYFGNYTIHRRRNFGIDFIGCHLEQDIIFFDCISFFHKPFGYGTFLNTFTQFRHYNFKIRHDFLFDFFILFVIHTLDNRTKIEMFTLQFRLTNF